MFKTKYIITVIGGSNLLPPATGNIYLMTDEKKKQGDGVVKIGKQLYYLLGIHKEEKYARSVGKTAAGAIVGGVLTGGIGAVVGGAIGARRSDESTYWLDLADYKTKQEFSIQVSFDKNSKAFVDQLRVVNPIEIGLAEG